LFVVFFIEEEICGIKNKVHRVNELVFRQNCVLGNIRPLFPYNISNEIYRDISEQRDHI